MTESALTHAKLDAQIDRCRIDVIDFRKICRRVDTSPLLSAKIFRNHHGRRELFFNPHWRVATSCVCSTV